MNPMRVAFLRISGQLLCQMLHDGTGMVRVTKNALPADARIIGVMMDFRTYQNVLLKIESDSFAEVKDSEPIPELEPVLFTRDD